MLMRVVGLLDLVHTAPNWTYWNANLIIRVAYINRAFLSLRPVKIRSCRPLAGQLSPHSILFYSHIHIIFKLSITSTYTFPHSFDNGYKGRDRGWVPSDKASLHYYGMLNITSAAHASNCPYALFLNISCLPTFVCQLSADNCLRFPLVLLGRQP